MWQEILINISIFFLICVFSVLLLWKLKFDNKGYKHLFVLYTLFWIPLMLLRSYTGSMANSTGDKLLAWIPLAMYGFIGIFTRIFADIFVFWRKNRKSFIYLALMIQLITYIPIICYPCLATNIIQSLGVGVGASCIGTYQLLFNEQYGKSKQLLTVSILAIPPILADLISSPLQNLVATFAKYKKSDPPSLTPNYYNPDVMKYLWCIGLGFVIISFIVCCFYKEYPKQLYKDEKYKERIKTNKEIFGFILVCFLGTLIAFVRFGNSGPVATTHIQWLTEHNSNAYEGYISIIFSLSQLTGAILVGLVFIKKIGRFWSYTIGCLTWISYQVAATFIRSVGGYFAIHALNGFSYGLIYNLILGDILRKKFNTHKQTPMGIYQSTLSVGIMASSWFVPMLKATSGNSKEVYWHNIRIINFILCCAIGLSWIIFCYVRQLEKWKYKQLWFRRKSNLKQKELVHQ